jgi:hypothetical protein
VVVTQLLPAPASNLNDEVCALAGLEQTRVLTVRSFRSFYRDPAQLVAELIQYIFLGVFTVSPLIKGRSSRA